ncbi:hypothetical protein AB0J21_31905 [Streptomyces sp. NPDC049954]|uniref:hypothetical protein n=1 Tax=Streptomyces sp. NPDC049954 TaxID=3155779 RepID=UPI003443AC82
MITKASALAASSSSSPGSLVLLFALGAVAVWFGARWAFNLGGAVDGMLARRRAVLELRGSRTGELSLADNDGFGPWFFRLAGSVMALAGVVLLLLGLALAVG